jgi:hypothetical protein
MKKLLSLLVMAVFAMPTMAADAPETKKACVKTIDAKTKKEVEKCKTVKVHKKLEGTPVPEPKKK